MTRETSTGEIWGEPLCAILPDEAVNTPVVIRGKVLSSATEQPISATVSDACGTAVAQTDSDGIFALNLPSSGRTYITVTAPGFTPQWRLVRALPPEVWLSGDMYLATEDPVVTEIGPAGGTHTNSDGTVVVSIPAGALSSPLPLRTTNFGKARELPMDLPTSSAFTTALLLSDVEGLSQPAEIRVKNALGFEPGTPVPVGYFDVEVGRWVPQENGVISEDGQWMVFHATHFSAYDLNYPPDDGDDLSDDENDDPCKKTASPFSVDLGTGAVSHYLPVPLGIVHGSPLALTLHYDSFAAQGLISAFQALAPLSTNYNPTSSIGLRLSAAGRTSGGARAPSQTQLDNGANIPMGALLAIPDEPSGIVHAVIEKTTRIPNMAYALTSRFGGSATSSMPAPVPLREAPILKRELPKDIPFDNRVRSEWGSGWRLADVPRLIASADGNDLMLQLGAEPVRMTNHFYAAAEPWPGEPLAASWPVGAAEGVAYAMMETGIVALDGTPSPPLVGGGFGRVFEGAAPESVGLTAEEFVALSGPVFFVPIEGALWRMAPGTPIERVTPEVQGSVDPQSDCDRDSGATSSLLLADLMGFDVAPDGTVFLADPACGQVLELKPDGTYRRFAGREADPADYSPGDGKAARDAFLYSPERVRRGANGTVFIVERGARRIRAVGTDGIIRTAVGGGSNMQWEDGAPAADLYLGAEVDLSVAGDTLVFWDSRHGMRRLTPDGRIEQVLRDPPSSEPGYLNIGRRAGAGTTPGLIMPGRVANDDDTVLVATVAGLVRIALSRGDLYGATEPDVDLSVRRTQTGFELLNADQSVRATFDTEGLLLAEHTLHGDISYSYTDGDGDGAADDPASITWPGGYQVSVTWAGGKASKIAAPGGREITLGYTGDHLTQVTLPDGAVVRYGYDPANRLTSIEAPNGELTQVVYNADGVVTSEITPANETRTLASRMLHGFLPSGSSTPEEPMPPHDEEGMVFGEPDGTTTTTFLDAAGRVLGTVDKTGVELTYERENGRVVRRYLTDGVDELLGDRFRYSAEGALESYGFDAGDSISWISDLFGHWGQTVTPTFDATGHLAEVSYGNASMSWGWTGGRLTSMVDLFGGSYTLQYDGNGNLSSLIDPLGRQRSWTRNAAGEVISRVDANGRTWTYTRDGLGRPLTVSVAGSGATSYTYDPAGRLQKIVDPGGRATDLTWNGAGQLTGVAHPATGTESSVWGTDGITQWVNGAGQAVSYVYNNGWLGSITAPEGVTQFVRNGLGQATQITSAGGGYTFTYSGLGTLSTVSSSNAATQPPYTMHYALRGRSRDYLIRPSGGTETFAEDGLSTSYSFSDTARSLEVSGTLLVDTAARERIHVVRAEDPTASLVSKSTLTFDEGRRLVGKDWSALLLQPALSYQYAYTFDVNGEVSSKTGPHGTEQYTHDAAGRLTAVVRDGAAAETFTWSIDGRMLSAGSRTFTYDTAGRLTGDGAWVYQHDAAGRLISRSKTGESWTYGWDSRNLLTTVRADKNGDGTFEHVVDYTYDPFGRRIQKSVNGVIRRYVWDAWRLIEEYDGQNNLVVERFYGQGGNELVAIRIGSAMYQVVTDRLGTVEALVAVSGSEAATARFDVTGRLLSQTGPLPPEAQVWAGHVFDQESGLFFMRTRYYDPEVGRFISPDSAGPYASTTLYTYVGGDFVGSVDPHGTQAAAPEGTSCPSGGAEAIARAGKAILDANEGIPPSWTGKKHVLNRAKDGDDALAGNHTHCNHFLAMLLKRCYDDTSLAGDKGDPLSANDQIQKIEQEAGSEDGAWEGGEEGLSQDRAVELAGEGKLVVATKSGGTNGHVAVVLPGSAVPDGASNHKFDKAGNEVTTSYTGTEGTTAVMQAGKTTGFLNLTGAWTQTDLKSVKFYSRKDDCGCKD